MDMGIWFVCVCGVGLIWDINLHARVQRAGMARVQASGV